MAFDLTYWQKNYSDPMSMDGIGYAKDHERHLKSFLALEHVDISSIVDLAFGYGHLIREMLRAFIPHTALGIEPSPYAFKKAKPNKWRPVGSTELTLLQEDLSTWSLSKRKYEPLDLGICTSVF